MNHTHHDFLAHHAPWGAYSSFILGHVGRGGGFALSDVHSPEQSVYLGFRRGSQQALVLPFLGSTGVSADDFSSGAVARGNLERGIRIVESHEFTRDYRWASDTWTLDGLRFSIHSPFGSVPTLEHLDDLPRRLATCPCVVATIEFDNRTSSEPVRVLFALDGVTRPSRLTRAGGCSARHTVAPGDWRRVHNPTFKKFKPSTCSVRRSRVTRPSRRTPASPSRRRGRNSAQRPTRQNRTRRDRPRHAPGGNRHERTGSELRVHRRLPQPRVRARVRAGSRRCVLGNQPATRRGAARFGTGREPAIPDRARHTRLSGEH
ncbi:MAG: hypothetical protein HC933_06460 [Pleurocapsa sp. SU_196_0]|nr:hypothetical protein [Pleurocapsa sp. SU_196_0]